MELGPLREVDSDARDAVRVLLKHIGENPDREGLKDTPKRVVKSFSELYGGYWTDEESLFTTFENGKCKSMVVVSDIDFYSMCLAGSTFIDTPRGRIPISRLRDGEFVYCWDEASNCMTIAKAKNPRVTGRNKQLWRVYTDKDTILCTGNHKLLTYNRGWVQAKDLAAGDSVIALNKGSVCENGKTRCYLTWTGKAKQIPEHRFVYESINGISDGLDIHHLNKKPNDNSPENLTAMTRSHHNALHRKEDGPTGFALFTDEQRIAMRDTQIKAIKESQTEDVRKKRAASVKAYWDSLSAEERQARNHRVLLVEKTEWFEDVWCMDVPVHHNFVANGMVVHNCEHHMLPFFGKATIAYIPDGKIIGLSKLARILDMFARRLQVQERLTEQVTDCLERNLKPKGSACIISATHFCMSCRGVKRPNAITTTSSLTGVFEAEASCRAELMSFINKG